MKQQEEYNNDNINFDRDIAILLDDFYSYLSWTNMLRLTDRKNCMLDVKYSKTNIVAIYICITGNGPVHELYKKLRENNPSINIEALIRRIRYIIKYERNPIVNRIRDMIRIFEKGNKKDFYDRKFNIEFNKEITLEEVKKITLDLEFKRQIFQDIETNQYYQYRIQKNKINEYSTIEDIDDITDRIISNKKKSEPGKKFQQLLVKIKKKETRRNSRRTL